MNSKDTRSYLSDAGRQSSACTSESIETLPNGAQQSRLAERCDLLPGRSVLAVARVLAEGAAKYSENNWVGIPLSSHINHCLRHLFLLLDGDVSEDHLAHAACRMLMALERRIMDQTAEQTCKA